MRNPNGYGSVHKLSGNRRRPWAARVTIGYDNVTGYQIYKYVGYYATRSEAMRALALYNGDTTEAQKVTLEEVYNEWKEEHAPTVKSFKQYSSAFKAYECLYRKPIEKLTIRDFEGAGLESGKSKIVLDKSKIVLSNIYAYAYRKGYIDESKASLPKFIKFVGAQKKEAKQKHRAFTHEEVNRLWENKDDETVRIILFMIYSGVRSEEIFNLRTEDVHLSENYFEIKASKTAAGLRKVPIADKVRFIAEVWSAQNSPYFAPIRPRVNTLDYFRRTIFKGKCAELGLNHLAHDTRYTTATFMTEAGVDLRYIQLILGHAQKDVTNAVYAKKISNDVLLEAINKI